MSFLSAVPSSTKDGADAPARAVEAHGKARGGKGRVRLSALLLAAISAAAPAAQGLPGIPEDLLNHSAVTCIRIDDSGKVAGAYIVESTGDAHRDQELVAWVKKLHWPKVKPGDKSRNMWFAMPIAFGDVIPPDAPASCMRR